jgi:hypothetical protein
VLEEPPPALPVAPRSKGLLKNKEKEAARAAAAAADAAAAAAMQSVVRIKAVDGVQAKVTCAQVGSQDVCSLAGRGVAFTEVWSSCRRTGCEAAG